jgi:hypothetical protein
MRLPNFHTLDVRVERRIARVTINNSPINLMDATLGSEFLLKIERAVAGHQCNQASERGDATKALLSLPDCAQRPW